MPSGSGYSVVPVGKAFQPLRIIQLILGVVILGLSAYLVSLFHGLTGFGADGPALAIFTALATMIFSTYWFVATSPSGAKYYNYWAIFAVEAFVLIFWLCSFAVIASYVSALVATTSITSDFTSDFTGITDFTGDVNVDSDVSDIIDDALESFDLSFKKHKLAKRATTDPYTAIYYADLALCVLNFVLYGVTFVLFTIRLFKHRATKRYQGAPTADNKAEQGAASSQWR